VAQREIVAALENAMDARRARINLSQSTVNWVKWSCMFAQAVCALIAIAMVHSDNRAAAAIAMGIFATGVAVCALLIASHDRPFSGEISVKPDVLLQVRPE
jgi:K+-sensing histidine kinase KdpD